MPPNWTSLANKEEYRLGLTQAAIDASVDISTTVLLDCDIVFLPLTVFRSDTTQSKTFSVQAKNNKECCYYNAQNVSRYICPGL
jgi:hypothetical protein